MRFVPAWGWVCWDGRRWCRRGSDSNPDGTVAQFAKDTIGRLPSLAREFDEDGLLAHAHASERVERLNAMVRLAESEPEVRATPSQFDRDPWRDRGEGARHEEGSAWPSMSR